MHPNSFLNKKWSLFLLAAIIITFIIYFDSLFFEFLLPLDDDWLIVSNESIHELNFKSILDLFINDSTDLHYHPLTYLSLMFNYAFANETPFFFKLTTLILHLSNGALLYCLIIKLNYKKYIAFAAVSLFLVASLNTESIVWASTRRQTLSLFFCLNSLIFFINYVKNKYDLKDIILSMLFMLLAILSKSSFIIIPVIYFIFWHFYTKEKWFKKEFIIPFAISIIVSLFFIILNLGIDEERNILKREFDYTLFKHIVFIAYSYSFYWVKFIFSYPQGIFYPALSESILRLPWYYYVLSIHTIISIVFTLLTFWSKSKEYGIPLALYFINIAPFLNLMFFPLGDLPMLVADRYFYHAGAWIILFLVVLIDQVFSRKFFAIIIFGLFLSQVLYIRLYIPHWKNSISILEHTLENYPSEEFYYWLGVEYFNHCEIEEAINSFNKADNLNKDIWINSSWPIYLERSVIYVYDKNTKKIDELFIKMDEREADKCFLEDYKTFLEKEFNLNIQYVSASNCNNIRYDNTAKYLNELYFNKCK